jgi:hypothetical protein
MCNILDVSSFFFLYICVLVVLTCGRRQTKKDDRCALIRVLIYVCSCGCLYVVAAEAQQRLDALEEFGVLGSGYELAQRDLEIRGAGSLLGADQSGEANDVGVRLYMQVL